MKLSILERYGFLEVSSRIILGKFPKIKKMAKKMRASSNKGGSSEAKDTAEATIDPRLAAEYFARIDGIIEQNDTVLIHSSMDGLESIGITAEAFMDFMRKQVSEKQVTFVLPCFPITNLKLPNPKSRPYDPKKTLCWTGMLPNTFIADSDVIRSTFPYNSLAAMGPKAEEMMENDDESMYVYDSTSPWQYLVKHHAKILFVGVKASCSNTMAIHMTPDYMGDSWPVNGWYEDRVYKVRANGEVKERPIIVQKDSWYQYCMEERTSGRLKKAGVLTEEYIGSCNLGVVEDCYDMMEVMVNLAKRGKLSYMVPRKYRKK